MDYVERIQAQSNSNTWAEQMNKEIFQSTSLSYALVKEGISSTTNMELGSRNTHDSHTNITTNMYTPQIHKNNNLSNLQSLVLSVVSYMVN